MRRLMRFLLRMCLAEIDMERSTCLSFFRLPKRMPDTLAIGRFTMFADDGRTLEVIEDAYAEEPGELERIEDDALAALHNGIDVVVMTCEPPEMFQRLNKLIEAAS